MQRFLIVIIQQQTCLFYVLIVRLFPKMYGFSMKNSCELFMLL